MSRYSPESLKSEILRIGLHCAGRMTSCIDELSTVFRRGALFRWRANMAFNSETDHRCLLMCTLGIQQNRLSVYKANVRCTRAYSIERNVVVETNAIQMLAVACSAHVMSGLLKISADTDLELKAAKPNNSNNSTVAFAKQ
jgi:hypothetical protein